MAHLLSVLVAAPAAGALLILMLAVLPGARVGLVRIVTCAASALTLLLALPLWLSFQPRGAQWQFVEQVDAAGWRLLAGLDGFAVALVLVTAIVGMGAALLVTRESSTRVRACSLALLMMETGVLGALVSLELRQMFVFWQLAVLALVALTMLSGARRAAVVGIALLVVGAAGMLSGLLALGEQYQSLASVASFDVRQFQTMPVRRPVQMQAFVLLALACLTPFALLALYAWFGARASGTERSVVGTPEPTGAAQAFAAGLLASTLVALLPIFGFLRIVLPVMPQATRTFATTMVIAGGVFAALAVVAAAMSRARIAVYWIGLAQALLATVGLFAATPNSLTGATIQLLAAGLAVAALVPITAMDTTYVASGSSRTESANTTGSRIDAVVVIAAIVAIAAGVVGGRLLASGLAPLGRAAVYGTLLVNLASALVLASAGWRRSSGLTSGLTGGSGRRVLDLAIAGPSLGVLLAIAIHPAPLLARLETSVARVIVRVSPEYAPQVADCLNQPAPPPPADSGLPTGMMLAAPCTDASSAGDPAVKR